MHKTSFSCLTLMVAVIILLTSVSPDVGASDTPQKSVIVTFPKDFPPYFNVTPEGVPYGFAIEVISEVARTANIKLEYLPADNWPEALEKIRSGKADLIPNMGITPERGQLVLFTQPYESFSVRIFSLQNTQNIKSINDLKGLRVGTVHTSIALNLVKNIDFIQYSNSEQVIRALLNQKLDALILPDIVVNKITARMGKSGHLTVVGEPITAVERAIGVAHANPELYQKINRALTEYLRSEEFQDTQHAWGKKPEGNWSQQDLIISNILFFLALCLLIGGTLYRRFRRRKQGVAPSNSKIVIRTVSIIAVLFFATLLSMAMTLWLLYETALDGQKTRLVTIAQNRAKIVESAARLELNKNVRPGIELAQNHDEILYLAKETLLHLKKFGETGEFTFARKAGDQIAFIMRQRHSDAIYSNSVSWHSANAEPMRRALSGRSGTLIGSDYRGTKVLAAHEPVKIIDAGIVAKIDLAEVRSPYIKAGLISLVISQGIILIGYFLFSFIASPILSKLSRSYIQLQAIIEHSSNLIVIKNANGETVLSSPAYNAIEEGKLIEGESNIAHSDGSTHTYLTTQFDLKSPDQIPFGSCQISTDITKRVAAELELKQYALAFENTSEGVVITDANAVIISVNSAFERITGYEREEAYGQRPSFIKSGRHDQDFYLEMWSTLKSKGHWSGEIWNRKKNGEIYPEWLNINAVKSDDDVDFFYVGVFTDISSMKETQEELYYLAHHDPLTKLPNRLLLKDRLDHALKNAHREQGLVALLVLDLDRFKNINDSLGHPAGDALLKDVAARLKSLVRENDTVARLGGDEFAIIAENISSFHSAAQLASKIVTGMISNFNLDGQEVYTSISIGIAVYPQDGKTHDDLLKNADTALYKAKEQGRNNYQLYTEDLSDSALEKLVMGNQISRAISNHEFAVHYQPQFDIETGNLVSAEALARWHHPELGMVAPDKFIPLAEENGLIAPLGEFIFKMACEQMKRWMDSGYELDRMAVNLSGKQLARPDLYEEISAILDSTGLPPHKLELEITEGFIMAEGKDSISTLEALSNLGITIAIDDFGTGYSSLAYLKRLPIRTLKIDRSFVNDLPHDDEDIAISRAVIALGHSLGMHIIAEGVENSEQLEFLKNEGCEIMQGYLTGRPVSSKEFEETYLQSSTMRG